MLDNALFIKQFDACAENSIKMTSGVKLGSLGVSLMGLMANEYFGESRFRKDAIRIAEESLEKICSEDYSSSFFDMELSEVGWFVEFVKRHQLIDSRRLPSISNLDEIVFESIRQKLKNDNFDTCSGVLAEGFYLLSKRKKTEPVVKALESIVHAMDNFLHNAEHRHFFTGVSHGLSGKLIFLSKVLNEGISTLRCLKLIRIIAERILSTYCPNDGRLFPIQLGAVNRGRANCWSYGDPGILYALHNAAGQLSGLWATEQTLIWSHDILDKSSDTLLRDYEPGIWYGHAGIILFYREIYEHTKHPFISDHLKIAYNKIHSFLKDSKNICFNTASEALHFESTLVHGWPGIFLASLMKTHRQRFRKYLDFVYF